MTKIWLNNSKAVVAVNKVILCDVCPCGCAEFDAVEMTNTVNSIDPAGAIGNVNGIWVLPKWDGLPKSNSARTYTMPYSDNAYWLLTDESCLYVACIDGTGMYVEVWDDGYDVGPRWKQTYVGVYNGSEFCNNLTGYSDRRLLNMDFCIKGISL